jgi:hypothetical protein
MKNDVWKNSPFGEESIFHESWEENKLSRSNRILVTEIKGPSKVCPGGMYEFRVTKFNIQKVDLYEAASKIKWGFSAKNYGIIPINKLATVDYEKKEVVLKWSIPKINDLEFIQVYAWLEAPDDIVSASASVLQFPFLFHKYKEKGLDQNADRIADDLCYGDGVTETEHFRYTISQMEKLGFEMRFITMKKPVNELWGDFKKMVGLNFTSSYHQELKNTAFWMINRFEKNKGGEFSSETLNAEVFRHPSSLEFMKNIKNGIKNKLIKHNFNPVLLFDSEVYLKSSEYGRPSFYKPGDILTGLTIMINDTWAYEVLITDFRSYDNRKFSIGYKILLYDHFGLDIPDVKNSLYYGFDGFRAWFALQHLHNHKPFITKIESKEIRIIVTI